MGRVDDRVKRALSALTSTILEYLELDRNMAKLQQNMMEFGPSDPDVRREMMKMTEDRMVLNTLTTEKLKGLYYQRPSGGKNDLTTAGVQRPGPGKTLDWVL